MSETTRVRPHRVRELVFALCTAWLVLQNVLLFLLIAWQPLTGLRIATLVLLRVVIHAATLVAIPPGAGVLGVACAVPWVQFAVMGGHHV